VKDTTDWLNKKGPSSEDGMQACIRRKVKDRNGLSPEQVRTFILKLVYAKRIDKLATGSSCWAVDGTGAVDLGRVLHQMPFLFNIRGGWVETGHTYMVLECAKDGRHYGLEVCDADQVVLILGGEAGSVHLRLVQWAGKDECIFAR
jgi:hypothetical protein